MSNITLEQKNQFSLMTIVCMIGFFLSNISYLPIFTENGLTQYLSYPAWAMILGTVFLYNQHYLSFRDIKFVIILLGAFILMAMVQCFSDKNYLSSLLTKCFILVVIIMLAGGLVARTGKTRNEENMLFYSYILASVILCVVVFRQFLMDQDLSSSIYSYGSKNETAFLAATSIVMLLFMQPAKETKLRSLLKYALIVFFAYIIATMRCRSMLVGIAVALLIRLFQKDSSKGTKIFIVLSFLVLGLSLLNKDFYNTLINNIIFSNRDSTDLNDLSSGRIDQIAWGLEQFRQDMFLGTGDNYTVDCFYVSVLMQYGLVMGSALIILGIYPVLWGLWNYKKIKNPTCMIMIVCALVYAIGGIFEENAPFGPGARCYLSWFLFGYLRVQQVQDHLKGGPYEENRIAGRTTDRA